MSFVKFYEDEAAIEWMYKNKKKSSVAWSILRGLAWYQYIMLAVKNGDRIFVGPSKTKAVELVMKQLETIRPPTKRRPRKKGGR